MTLSRMRFVTTSLTTLTLHRQQVRDGRGLAGDHAVVYGRADVRRRVVERRQGRVRSRRRHPLLRLIHLLLLVSREYLRCSLVPGTFHKYLRLLPSTCQEYFLP